MTDKEKAEAYDEALERAKVINPGTEDYNIVTSIFPELKEGEDEHVRREIISVFKQLDEGTTIFGRNYDYAKWIAWLEKQGEPEPRQEQSGDVVSVIERDGEQWVRVCALGEDFIVAAHDYREGDKTEFTWEEACKIGTFSKKQAYIILALLDEINAKLREIGGEPLDSPYWSSSESYQNGAWRVNFSSGSVTSYAKYNSFVARAVAAF